MRESASNKHKTKRTNWQLRLSMQDRIFWDTLRLYTPARGGQRRDTAQQTRHERHARRQRSPPDRAILCDRTYEQIVELITKQPTLSVCGRTLSSTLVLASATSKLKSGFRCRSLVDGVASAPRAAAIDLQHHQAWPCRATGLRIHLRRALVRPVQGVALRGAVLDAAARVTAGSGRVIRAGSTVGRVPYLSLWDQ